jgi:hypothetical protein
MLSKIDAAVIEHSKWLSRMASRGTPNTEFMNEPQTEPEQKGWRISNESREALMLKYAGVNTYTRAQFEKDKTERIAALCSALAALKDAPYGDNAMDQILSHLNWHASVAYETQK